MYIYIYIYIYNGFNSLEPTAFALRYFWFNGGTFASVANIALTRSL